MDLSSDILFIDTSYVIFYRYYSTVTWYNNVHPDTPLDPSKPLPDVFLKKYHKMFEQMVDKLTKMHDVQACNVVFALDCPRETLWRVAHEPSYKATRQEKSKSFNSTIFPYTYDHLLQGRFIVSHKALEADDCIAIIVKHLRTMLKFKKLITVITNDNDYIQLHRHNVHLVNLQDKCLYNRIADVQSYLRIKEIMGDVSDNIPAIGPRIGPKTAEKLAHDAGLLHNRLKSTDVAERYERNKLLINFDNIPKLYADELLASVFP